MLCGKCGTGDDGWAGEISVTHDPALKPRLFPRPANGVGGRFLWERDRYQRVMAKSSQPRSACACISSDGDFLCWRSVDGGKSGLAGYEAKRYLGLPSVGHLRWGPRRLTLMGLPMSLLSTIASRQHLRQDLQCAAIVRMVAVRGIHYFPSANS